MSLPRTPGQLPAILLAALGLQALAQDPTPPQLTFSSTPTGLQLQWTSAGPGFDYTLQTRDALEEGPWLLAPGAQPWPFNGTLWITSPGAGENARFFRLLAVPRAERGRVLAVTRLSAMTVPQITFLLTLAGIPLTPTYAVDLHKVVYETIDPWGARIQASGVLAVPVNAGKALPLLSYQHGTLVQTNEAPSADQIEQIPGIGFATSGYVAALPDYLGLGDGPGPHPYHHARSEATAAIDLLRAARTWCQSNAVALTDQLFLCGYSQGGHATLALHRELEQAGASEFVIAASAPMAGAYDLAGVTTEDFLSGRPLPNPYYFPYLLAAYQTVYQLTNTLADLLAAPYNTTLPPLLARRASGSELNAALPSAVATILKPEILTAFRNHPRHPLRRALQDNTLLDWTPVAPLRLYHCNGDQDVPYANAESALAAFHARGATHVQLVNPQNGGDHGDCVLPSFVAAKAWFDTLK